MTDISPSHEEHLYTRVVGILEDARSRVSRTVNTAMVHSYWLNPVARAFYEIEAVREGWSSRELERQLASHLFERLAKSRDKEQVLALARQGQVVATPAELVSARKQNVRCSSPGKPR